MSRAIDRVRNVMAHTQKPDFVFRRNGRVYLNRQGASVQSTTGSRGVLISGSNAGYTMFRGSVKGTEYPLHSSVSLSLPLPASPCATTFQLHSTSTPPIGRTACTEPQCQQKFALYLFTSRSGGARLTLGQQRVVFSCTEKR
jgi:hypothetical protein